MAKKSEIIVKDVSIFNPIEFEGFRKEAGLNADASVKR